MPGLIIVPAPDSRVWATLPKHAPAAHSFS